MSLSFLASDSSFQAVCFLIDTESTPYVYHTFIKTQ